MHHKRRRPRNSRAGCKLCKPWKISGYNSFDQLKPSEQRSLQPEENPPPPRRKASRTKWCKGKVGVPHQLVCMTYEETKGKIQNHTHYKPEGLAHKKSERFLVCTVCGKELSHYWGWSKEFAPLPAWVTR